MTDERLREGWGERMVGDVVAEDDRQGAVFTSFGIDFCCGGRRTVAAACAEAGVEVGAVARALSGTTEAAGEADGSSATHSAANPASWDLAILAGYIVSVHHAYVRDQSQSLRDVSAKLARVHGARHPELDEIRDLVAELMDELTEHMREEEDVLFPRIAALETASTGGTGTLGSAVVPLEDDHTRAGDLMRRIRELSDDFTTPPDGCATYTAGYAALAAFEEDLHRHVHLENNVLFPRAMALEEALLAAGPA